MVYLAQIRLTLQNPMKWRRPSSDCDRCEYPSRPSKFAYDPKKSRDCVQHQKRDLNYCVCNEGPFSARQSESSVLHLNKYWILLNMSETRDRSDQTERMQMLILTFDVLCRRGPFFHVEAELNKLTYTLHLSLYHSLGRFSRRKLMIFFSSFPQQTETLTFHANCLFRRQFA